VRRAYAFGSVLTDRFRTDSDVDLLVTFKKIPFGEYTTNYWSLEDELEKLLQRKIDVVVEKNLTNPYLKKIIAETRTVIYE
jgi:predicted nucleotidyltransferase